MAPEPISTACFTNPFHPSVCLYVYPLSLLGNGPVNTFPRQRIYKTRILGSVVFYAVRFVLKVSLCVCLCTPLSLLGNGSVNTFPRQRIAVGVVFYTFRHASKESKQLVLLSTTFSK
jgi:hypothetical protein